MDKFPITHYEYALNSSFIDFKGIVDYIDEVMKDKSPEFETYAMEMTKSENKTMLPLHEDSLRMSLEMSYHMWRMKNTGEKIFYITKDLCSILSDMKLTIDSEFLQSPFEEIYLYLDQDDLTITDHTGTRPVKGIYVNLQKYTDFSRKFRILASSGAKGIEEGYDINNYASFTIPDHGELEYILNSHLDTFKEDNKGKSIWSNVNFDELSKLLRLTVNVLLYISSNGADINSVKPTDISKLAQGKKNLAKKEKLLRQAKTSASIPFILVGKNISYNKSTSLTSGNGQKLDHQVRVAGHWRGQWKGSEKDGTRKKEVIRIESYVKGPDLSQEVNKRYIVK